MESSRVVFTGRGLEFGAPANNLMPKMCSIAKRKKRSASCLENLSFSTQKRMDFIMAKRAIVARWNSKNEK